MIMVLVYLRGGLDQNHEKSCITFLITILLFSLPPLLCAGNFGTILLLILCAFNIFYNG